jgi:hypothetical protein
MIGLNVTATSEVACQMVRILRGACLVNVAQSGLLSVRMWQPAEKVIEATILHHNNDNMLDP